MYVMSLVGSPTDVSTNTVKKRKKVIEIKNWNFFVKFLRTIEQNAHIVTNPALGTLAAPILAAVAVKLQENFFFAHIYNFFDF